MFATLNNKEAKTHLLRCRDLAFDGRPLIIARAVIPLVGVEAIVSPKKISRVGGLAHLGLKAPTIAQWNAMDSEIAETFNGK